MTEQEQFEEWAKTEFPYQSLEKYSGNYLFDNTQFAWTGWQARAVISAPEGCTPADAKNLRKANHDLAGENTSLLKLVTDIRFACGDEGKRMQPELVEYIKGMAEEIKRLKSLLSDAATDVQEWGDYAPESYQQQHDLTGDVRKYREAGML